ncbi:hypothetical protein ONS96_014693 [Cadophora gregata f. sp. sojae]|nr:hypothetical protein ONS96_014693 [Cadophora gregata f. sp. sojae]
MKLTNPLSISTLLLTAAITDLTLAACYGSGEVLNKANANYHAKRACMGYDGHAGAFQGFFSAGQNKQACINNDAGVGGHLILGVRNLNQNAGFDLDDADCFKELGILIALCNRGGTGTVAGWFFR